MTRDSPRWCGSCDRYGDHHTDRCPRKPGCDHRDVRCANHFDKRAIACFTCGRLFGTLHEDGTFVAHNPGPVPALAVATAITREQRSVARGHKDPSA